MTHNEPAPEQWWCVDCGCTPEDHTLDGCGSCGDCYHPRMERVIQPEHEFNWQTGYCACGWAGPAIDEVPDAHAEHVRDAIAQSAEEQPR